MQFPAIVRSGRVIGSTLALMLLLAFAACSSGDGSSGGTSPGLGGGLSGGGGGGGIGGGGGGGGEEPFSSETGGVSIVLTDAPFDELVSFTIDITRITLLAANTDDATVFPADSAEGSALAVDLLSLQGLTSFLSSVEVLEGTYSGIEFQFENPAAIDVDGDDQTIITTETTLTATFTPSLTVTAGGAQAVEIDFDLESSVTDLGGDNILFSPTLVVTEKTEAISVERFALLVASIDEDASSFTGAIKHLTDDAPEGGTVQVFVDDTTSFSDGAGNNSTGDVLDNVVENDAVFVDGSLLNGTVTATKVARLPGTEAGEGLPANGVPGFVALGGTITNVNDEEDIVDIVVQSMKGPASALPNRLETLSIDMNETVSLVRGGESIHVGDLNEGSYLTVYAEEDDGDYFAIEAEEQYSYLVGEVDNVCENGLELEAKVNLDTVNGLPADDYDLGGCYWFDLPFAFPIDEGDTLKFFAFFDDGDLTDYGFASVPLPRLPEEESESPPQLAPRFIAGTVVEESVGLEGILYFEMDFSLLGGDEQTLYVQSDSNTLFLLVDASGAATAVDSEDAAEALDADPALVEAVGRMYEDGDNYFIAEFVLRIYAAMPTAGIGSYGRVRSTLVGTLVGADFSDDDDEDADIVGDHAEAHSLVELNDNDELEFSMQLGVFGGPTGRAKVTVKDTATLTLVGSGPIFGDGDSDVSYQSALEKDDVFEFLTDFGETFIIQADGLAPASGGRFTCDLALRLVTRQDEGAIKQTYTIRGTRSPETETWIDNKGMLHFWIDQSKPDGSVGRVEVITAADTTFDITSRFGVSSTVMVHDVPGEPDAEGVEFGSASSQARIAAEIAGSRNQIECIGTTAASGKFTADKSLRVSLPARPQHFRWGGELDTDDCDDPYVGEGGELVFNARFWDEFMYDIYNFEVEVSSETPIKAVDALGNSRLVTPNQALYYLAEETTTWVEAFGSEIGGEGCDEFEFYADIGLCIFVNSFATSEDHHTVLGWNADNVSESDTGFVFTVSGTTFEGNSTDYFVSVRSSTRIAVSYSTGVDFVTLDEAADLLDGNEVIVEAVGSGEPDGMGEFTANVALNIIWNAGDYRPFDGQVVVGTADSGPSEEWDGIYFNLGATGSRGVLGGVESETCVDVFIPWDAEFFMVEEDGALTPINSEEAYFLLDDDPEEIELRGLYDDDEFDASFSVVITPNTEVEEE